MGVAARVRCPPARLASPAGPIGNGGQQVARCDVLAALAGCGLTLTRLAAPEVLRADDLGVDYVRCVVTRWQFFCVSLYDERHEVTLIVRLTAPADRTSEVVAEIPNVVPDAAHRLEDQSDIPQDH